jgi:hypothetical protein
MPIPFPRAQWLFPIAVSLHNLEESIWMPAFWREHEIHFWPSAALFRAVAAALALVAFLITFWSIRSGKRSAGTYVFALFALVLALNAFWHLGVTLWFRGYTPGVLTALVLNLPITLYLLRRAIREEFIVLPRHPLKSSVVR